MAPAKKFSKQKKRTQGVRKFKKAKPKSPAFKDANSVMRPEKKWIDVINTLAPPVGSAWVTTPLHLNPTTGSTGASNARIGSKINMTSMDVKLNILWPGNQAVNSPQQIRTVIVYDRQANAAAPSRGDVFADGVYWNSPKNLFNQDRFIVLVDELSDQIDSNGQFCVAQHIFRKMALDAVWPANGSGYPNSGAISMWVAANQDWNSAATAVLPTVQIYSRIRFVDA